MFATSRLFTSIAAKRAFSTSAANLTKVAVIGAAGGIGQPLSLLLKESPRISELSLYDIGNAHGVAADVSHINTDSTVTGYTPKKGGLEAALKGAHVVVIPAGVPRKPGMTRDDLFNTNAGIVRDLAVAAAKYCPDAHFLIISNPVNSTVPIFAETLKKAGVFNPKRLYGVTTLDSVRASRFVSEMKHLQASDCKVNVIGGHAGVTIIPLLSQTGLKFSQEEIDALTHRIQFGGDEVVVAKDGSGSATLSMAFAGARMANAVLEATVGGKKGIIEPAYVKSDVLAKEGVEYFSTNLELGPEGIEKIHDIGEISDYEKKLITEAIPLLKGSVTKAIEFVNK
ncbi:malate dehydrogenase, NAD-dependent [Cokeromyces recurvatus]|uniref:malate dehydrogenase, NAD-dependent n=1 Tax=Cokeromyces recurvatus TaxID=90255 RepID=UPI002220404D|nr:malate dehydrogenase, NAD-dependent [Cokeromyces recurvatus]KAI7907084.1 malate dehydrogenase, NAD-dependent [Cokeromyces recurvatus]